MYITHIKSCIYLDNGMGVKTESVCSLIEYDKYFKESECEY